MRQDASGKGWTLNEKGLFAGREPPFILLKTETEESIFNKLGMRYLTPQERHQLYTTNKN